MGVSRDGVRLRRTLVHTHQHTKTFLMRLRSSRGTDMARPTCAPDWPLLSTDWELSARLMRWMLSLDPRPDRKSHMTAILRVQCPLSHAPPQLRDADRRERRTVLVLKSRQQWRCAFIEAATRGAKGFLCAGCFWCARVSGVCARMRCVCDATRTSTNCFQRCARIVRPKGGCAGLLSHFCSRSRSRSGRGQVTPLAAQHAR